jgi:hypothetical protein
MNSPDPDVERSQLAEYEQRLVCRLAAAPFEPPDLSRLDWLGPTVAEGNRLVRGTRRKATRGWSGWTVVAADRPWPSNETLRFEDGYHLASIRPDLLRFLGLPVGWLFEVLPDGSWTAWSPKERLLTWIAGFVDGSAATRDTALAIAELTGNAFGTTELAVRLVDPLQAWARDGSHRDEAVEGLAWGRDWLHASPIR